MDNDSEHPQDRSGPTAASPARRRRLDEEAFDNHEQLREIADGLSAARGEAFFRLLARHLCTVLKADLACIGELPERDQLTVRTIAMFDGTRFLEDVEYVLTGTPCREAVIHGHCSYPTGVQALFPEDRLLATMGIESYYGVALKGMSNETIGVLSVMRRTSLTDFRRTEAILGIFASRASAELERRKLERALRESEARNRAILNALPDMILILDAQGAVHDYSAKHGEAAAARPGKDLASVFTPEVARAILDRCAATGPEAPSVVEYSLHDDAGLRRFYEARTVHFVSDKFLSIVRDVTPKKEIESDLKESQMFARRIAETTPSVLFVYDLIDRRSVYANDRTMDVIGYTPKEIEDMGGDFISKLMHPDDLALLPGLAKEYAKRKDGEVFEHIFRLKHKDGQWRWLHRSATIFCRTPDGRPRQIVGVSTDITRFKEAERDLQDLSARLLSTQDRERRRIARDLHDTTGQNLTLLGIHLEAVKVSQSLDPDTRNRVSECRELCKTSLEEIRTLSYLLHPPELDLLGLAGALRSYVTGVEKRSGIDIRLDIDGNVGRFPSELEIDLFRVVQQALSNVLQHSGSKTAVIRLGKRDSELVLEVEDGGCGLPFAVASLESSDPGFGVGIPGMRERLRQYGGRLEIRSSGHGTLLTGAVPLVPPRNL